MFCRPWTNMFNKTGASTEHCGNHSSGAPAVGLWPTAPWKLLPQSNPSVTIDTAWGRMTEGLTSGLVCQMVPGVTLSWSQLHFFSWQSFLTYLMNVIMLMFHSGRKSHKMSLMRPYQGMPGMVPVLPGEPAPGTGGCSSGERWAVVLKWHLCLQ